MSYRESGDQPIHRCKADDEIYTVAVVLLRLHCYLHLQDAKRRQKKDVIFLRTYMSANRPLATLGLREEGISHLSHLTVESLALIFASPTLQYLIHMQ